MDVAVTGLGPILRRFSLDEAKERARRLCTGAQNRQMCINVSHAGAQEPHLVLTGSYHLPQRDKVSPRLLKARGAI